MVGQRIREARRAQNMTQEELAKRAGISRTALCKIETSATLNISGYTAVVLAKALGVSTDYLLCGEC